MLLCAFIILSIILIFILALLYDKLTEDGQKVLLSVISGILTIILFLLGIALLIHYL